MDTGVFSMSDDFVIRTYADMVYKIAVRYTKNLTDAEDVFSDTFLAYYRKPQEFASEEHRKAWLIRVTINFSRNLYRAQKRSAELDEAISCEERGFGTVENAVDLKNALAQMREEYREVVCLYYLHELSVKEIAQVVDRNESTIRTQLARGREQLRKFLA